MHVNARCARNPVRAVRLRARDAYTRMNAVRACPVHAVLLCVCTCVGCLCHIRGGWLGAACARGAGTHRQHIRQTHTNKPFLLFCFHATQDILELLGKDGKIGPDNLPYRRLAAFFIRGAFHDAGTHKNGVGGMDGSMLLTKEEQDAPPNIVPFKVCVYTRAWTFLFGGVHVFLGGMWGCGVNACLCGRFRACARCVCMSVGVGGCASPCSCVCVSGGCTCVCMHARMNVLSVSALSCAQVWRCACVCACLGGHEAVSQ